jgi:hypothetical protein
MKKESEIEKELRENEITPIAILGVNSNKEITTVRMQGEFWNLTNKFEFKNVWRSHDEESYTGKEEWYVNIKNNDIRLPEIKKMMLNRMIRETYRKNKKKGEILKELTKKGEVEIRETYEVIIKPNINNYDLYFSDTNIKINLYNGTITINLNRPVIEIVDEIISNIKKDIIEKICNGKNK